MKNLTFKQWMQAQYEPQELKEIAEHGCASAAPGGMIYYTETTDLYNRFAEDLHDIVGDYMQSTGQDDLKYLSDNLGDAVQFRNAMVWLCAELVAYDLSSALMD